MTEKTYIEKLVKEFAEIPGLFVVAVKVSSTNRITVLADTMSGITIDECVAIHRFLENKLMSEADDYELQVSSPGLDTPFSVIEQYLKNQGRKVDVTDDEGKKHTGILKNITKGGFELETEVKSKGKTKDMKDVSFNFDQVKSTKIVLTVK